jgi:lipopolysaccharide export system protein LptA
MKKQGSLLLKSMATGSALVLILFSTLPCQGSMFSKLAGPGEKVVLRAEKPEDGGENYMRSSTNPDGSIAKFEAVGHVVLRSPKLSLDADNLVYDANKGYLEATGNVTIDQESVNATCGKLQYDIESGVITLSDSPLVNQSNAQNKARFTGMDEFVINQKVVNTSVTMSGGEEILCEILQPEAGEEIPDSATPPPGEKTTGDFAGLGKDILITTRPKDGVAPVVKVDMENGAFGLFRATGSVILKSDQINLVADQLEYDGIDQTVQAFNNVYIRQEAIEADCQELLYELSTKTITLSGDPYVRKQEDGKIQTISNMDSFIIIQNPDGTTSTQINAGPTGQPEIVFESPEEKTETQKAIELQDDPGEINLDSPEDIEKISGTK